MDKYYEIKQLLLERTPFCITRFNDGEMTGVEDVGGTVARGDQKISESLHKHLNRALQHEQENYWKGMPCGYCFGNHRRVFDDTVSSNYPYKTQATVLINNGRWWLSFDWFVENVGDRAVYWIGGESQDTQTFVDKGVNIEERLIVPDRNAWRDYDSLADERFPEDAIIVLSCGPMSRVLACDYYSHQPSLTVLDVGSVWDPITRNKWFRCHTYSGGCCGKKPCPECNFDTEDERLIGKSKKEILQEIRNG